MKKKNSVAKQVKKKKRQKIFRNSSERNGGAEWATS